VYALEDAEGRPLPVPALAPGEPLRMRAARLALAGPLSVPGDLGACQGILAGRERRLRQITGELDEHKPVRQRFDEAAPNPALGAAVAEKARAALAAAGVSWAPTVECHASLCRIAAAAPASAPGWLPALGGAVARDPWFAWRVRQQTQTPEALYLLVEDR
jgi:hypothetical protein